MSRKPSTTMPSRHRTAVLRAISVALRRALGRMLRSQLVLHLGPVIVYRPCALSTARGPVETLGRVGATALGFASTVEFTGSATPKLPGRFPALVLLHRGRGFALLKLGPTQRLLLRTLLTARADHPDLGLKSQELAWRLKLPPASVRKALGRLAALLELLGLRSVLSSGRDGYRLAPMPDGTEVQP